VIPYLAYARSDIPDAGGVQSIGVIGRALEGAGVDEVVTVDVHSARDIAIFPMPLISLSPAEPLAEAIAADHTIDQVVAPDAGAFGRAREIAAALRAEDPLTAGQVSGARRVLVVDDVVDSGRTLLDCCTTLAAAGVEDIVIAVTHALFTGDARGLLELPVRAIFTTDTIPDVRRERPYLTRVVPIAPLIHAALADRELTGASAH
jgi:ribose-phosphate pyrophosphokinase